MNSFHLYFYIMCSLYITRRHYGITSEQQIYTDVNLINIITTLHELYYVTHHLCCGYERDDHQLKFELLLDPYILLHTTSYARNLMFWCFFPIMVDQRVNVICTSKDIWGFRETVLSLKWESLFWQGDIFILRRPLIFNCIAASGNNIILTK